MTTATVEVRPATDLVISRLREAIADIAAHEHPQYTTDYHCQNLAAFLGERMPAVLRRLADEQKETAAQKERNAALADEFLRETDRLRGKVADLEIHREQYFQIQALLDTVLGPNGEDSTGEGVVQEVALLVQRLNEARAEIDRLRGQQHLA